MFKKGDVVIVNFLKDGSVFYKVEELNESGLFVNSRCDGNGWESRFKFFPMHRISSITLVEKEGEPSFPGDQNAGSGV